ncbi:Holliday junction branch migration protein RuvA [Serinibacter salmoneus]|uniref:Holliday junction branch migration complex subunit RuvA n=1 Tax=Serinibacter salmoneus TaxID=556530 RepID=A0A2A9D189_9MICO|nr:Holliday junction branch migration protein RuvA [Serinibacter salmoneus]PFG19610.1 Holliday junction DNA helicase subunit RuvA [Serinibacter salmoneus]
MIALVQGEVRAVGLDHAVLLTSGVGMRVLATPATLASLRVGQECELHTSLVVREDSLTLYGFSDADEREVFETLQSVSGVGPRLALAVLAVHTPETLRFAVAQEDLAALVRVPGIGRKGASRLVLELGDKLGPPSTLAGAHAPGGEGEGPSGPAGSGASADSPSTPGVEADVAEALVGLGWPSKAASDAVAGVLERGDAPIQDAAAVLRAALQSLASPGR